MGLFIAGEGGDGSGKGTQMKMMGEWLDEEGYDVLNLSFPRYGHPAAEPIGFFLDGKLGNPHPILASLPYSIDRQNASPEILAKIAMPNGVVASDRFDASNLGHNGAKYDTTQERLAFFKYQRNYEHEVMGVPYPDQNFLFLVDPDVAQRNVDNKAARSYTDKKRDIHEADIDHLKRAYDTYVLLAETYPEEFTVINSMEKTGTMRSMEDIQSEFREKVKTLLALKGMAHVNPLSPPPALRELR